MINGVEFKELVTHVDERGFFREIIRVTDPLFSEGFGQWSQSLMYQDIVKAWHIHQKQIDWWYVASGVLKVGLYDARKDSSTFGDTMSFLMGDNQEAKILRIPTGVAHGCKCISGPATLFYITSQTYNPEDEGRIPFDAPEIDFDWLSGPEIS